MHPRPPGYTEVKCSFQEGLKLEAHLETSDGTRIESLSVPLKTGIELIAMAFGSLARTPGMDVLFAQQFGTADAIEHMRRFVASYDRFQAEAKGGESGS